MGEHPVAWQWWWRSRSAALLGHHGTARAAAERPPIGACDSDRLSRAETYKERDVEVYTAYASEKEMCFNHDLRSEHCISSTY